jgi:hypothetical protein
MPQEVESRDPKPSTLNPRTLKTLNHEQGLEGAAPLLPGSTEEGSGEGETQVVGGENFQHPEWMVDMAEKARKQLQAVEERLSVLRDVESKLIKVTTTKSKEHEVNPTPLILHLNHVESEEQKANFSALNRKFIQPWPLSCGPCLDPRGLAAEQDTQRPKHQSLTPCCPGEPRGRWT